jgi:hypothetical protein
MTGGEGPTRLRPGVWRSREVVTGWRFFSDEKIGGECVFTGEPLFTEVTELPIHSYTGEVGVCGIPRSAGHYTNPQAG